MVFDRLQHRRWLRANIESLFLVYFVRNAVVLAEINSCFIVLEVEHILLHSAEHHVVQLNFGGVHDSCQFASLEHLFEVQLLAYVSHVHYSVYLQVVDTVVHGCQIGSGIPKATV